MSKSHELGKRGEEYARSFLEQEGYIILEINWRSGRNEVDIIARKNEFAVFIEVKTRKNNSVLQPEESVTPMKQRQIIRVANAYLRYKQMDLEARFDIIALTETREGFKMNHIVDAFYVTL